jgi:AhpD family alkylhydroperoxidase
MTTTASSSIKEESSPRHLHARTRNIAEIVPDVLPLLQEFSKFGDKGGVPSRTIALVQLRASQINGCSICVEMHSRYMKMMGETDQRLFAVAAWRDSPYFTDAERAALALSESVTRLSDRPDPVPDEIWEEAARHYDEKGLAALIIAIAAINVWNRFNVSTRQVAGEWIVGAAQKNSGQWKA